MEKGNRINIVKGSHRGKKGTFHRCTQSRKSADVIPSGGSIKCLQVTSIEKEPTHTDDEGHTDEGEEVANIRKEDIEQVHSGIKRIDKDLESLSLDHCRMIGTKSADSETFMEEEINARGHGSQLSTANAPIALESEVKMNH